MGHIYTKTGDGGQTSLASGERVAKNSPRLKAYGELDELNSSIGLALVGFGRELNTDKLVLIGVQKMIFTISSMLATIPNTPLAERLPKLTYESVETLEKAIDRLDAKLPPLKNFILPAGSETSCRLHVARSICRRAERKLFDVEPGNPEQFAIMAAYLNRLSDYFFTLARYANDIAGKGDIDI